MLNERLTHSIEKEPNKESIDKRRFKEFTKQEAKEKLKGQYVCKVFNQDREEVVQEMQSANPEAKSAKYDTHPKGDINRIKEVIEELPEGGIAGLVGSSGSGKTETVAGIGVAEFFWNRENTLLASKENYAFFSLHSSKQTTKDFRYKRLEKQAPETELYIFDEFNCSKNHQEFFKQVQEKYPHSKFFLIYGGHYSNQRKREDIKNIFPEAPIFEIGHQILNIEELGDFIQEWAAFAKEKFSLDETKLENLKENSEKIKTLKEKYPMIPMVLNNVMGDCYQSEINDEQVEDLIEKNLHKYKIVAVENL